MNAEEPSAHLWHWAVPVQAPGPWSLLQDPWAQTFPPAEGQATGAQLPLQREELGQYCFVSTTPTWGYSDEPQPPFLPSPQ